MPGHVDEGVLDSPIQVYKKRKRVGRSTLAHELANPPVELAIRVRVVPFDEADEIEPVLCPIDEWIAAGKILDIRVDNIGWGMIETNGAVEAKGLGPAGQAADGQVVCAHNPAPP